MLRNFITAITFLSLLCGTAMAQSPDREGYEIEYNPIFDIDDQPLTKQGDREGYIRIELKYVPYKYSDFISMWRKEIADKKGHFFMFEAVYVLPNKYSMMFSQLRSNITCANYAGYTRPYQGNENCYTKIWLQSPSFQQIPLFDNIWMNAHKDIVYLKPEAGKQFYDMLINGYWYEYSPQQKKYIRSLRNTTGGN